MRGGRAVVLYVHVMCQSRREDHLGRDRRALHTFLPAAPPVPLPAPFWPAPPPRRAAGGMVPREGPVRPVIARSALARGVNALCHAAGERAAFPVWVSQGGRRELVSAISCLWWCCGVGAWGEWHPNKERRRRAGSVHKRRTEAEAEAEPTVSIRPLKASLIRRVSMFRQRTGGRGRSI